MVRYIAVGLVFLISVLALISRKNYSKYKDVEKKGFLSFVPYFLLEITPPGLKSYVRGIVRKNNILNTRDLRQEVDRELLKAYEYVVKGVFLAAVVAFLVTLKPQKEDDLYKVKRPEAGDSSVYVDIELEDEKSGKKENFNLEVSPREYSEEEFHRKSKEAEAYIDSCILGDNISPENICSDLELPSMDESGVLKIVWSSSEPSVISSTGVVKTEELDKDMPVQMTAEIKDSNYTATYKKDFVVKKDIKLTSSERAKASILNIEEQSRSEDELVLPHNLDDVKILRKSGWAGTTAAILIMGILAAFSLGYLRLGRLKEKGKERDRELEDEYFGFVNRLAIHIGSGLSLKDAFKHTVQSERCEYLRDEVHFMLNRISSGVSEGTAYMEFGRTIGSQEYLRLMSLISQNLSYGNSNLIKMLDSEIKTGFYIKREHIRKRGEEASEKLILPTSLLLVLVIVIIMYPAFIGM